ARLDHGAHAIAAGVDPEAIGEDAFERESTDLAEIGELDLFARGLHRVHHRREGVASFERRLSGSVVALWAIAPRSEDAGVHDPATPRRREQQRDAHLGSERLELTPQTFGDRR